MISVGLMKKNIALSHVLAGLVLLLASYAAAPALAQPAYGDEWPDRTGAGSAYGQRADDYDTFRGWRDHQTKPLPRPDFQRLQRDCARAGIEAAWDRSFYSAQYNEGPRLISTEDGWEMRGAMRLHSRSGFSYVDTICRLTRSGVIFRFR